MGLTNSRQGRRRRRRGAEEATMNSLTLHVCLLMLLHEKLRGKELRGENSGRGGGHSLTLYTGK